MIKRAYSMLFLWVAVAPLLATPSWMLPGLSFLQDHQLVLSYTPTESFQAPITRSDLLKPLLTLSQEGEAKILYRVRQELSPEDIHTNCQKPSQTAFDVGDESLQSIVRELSLRGILQLMPNHRLLPLQKATRFEMAAMLNRLRHFLASFESCLRSGEEIPNAYYEGRLPFQDVAASHWAYADVGELYERQVLQGVAADRFSGKTASSLIQVGVALSRFSLF